MIALNWGNDAIASMLRSVALPDMFRVRQEFSHAAIHPEALEAIVTAQLSRLSAKIRPGMHIAITAGSRQIRNMPRILHTAADFVRSRGARPFIVPAMGSHGGATAEGQLHLLHDLGITEQSVGCPILSDITPTVICHLPDGRPVYLDRTAACADGIILACRIKPHTGFRGKYESGIMKMMAIGLGKPAGAAVCHAQGVGHLAKNIELFGIAVLQNAPILGALAILENAYDETCKVVGVAPNEISTLEPRLLAEAAAGMARIWVESCDVLVVDQIGKNFSGDGMDPNITGTFCTPYATGGLRSHAVTILGLSAQTHGNAVGVGSAVAIPQALAESLRLEDMYINSLTSTVLTTVRIPMILKNHKQCIQAALQSCCCKNTETARIVRIANTLELSHIWLSKAYLPEVQQHPNLCAVSEPAPWQFDANGNLF